MNAYAIIDSVSSGHLLNTYAKSFDDLDPIIYNWRIKSPKNLIL